MDKACSSFRGDRYQKANRASRGGLLAAQKGSLPHSSVDKESALQFRRPQFESWIGKVPWRRDRLSTPVFLGFPDGSAGKECACNAGDLGSIPGWEDPLEKEEATHSVFWAGEFHGLYSPWDHKELDTTEQLSFTQKASLKSERTTYPGSSISSHPMEHPRSSDSDLGSPGMRAPL